MGSLKTFLKDLALMVLNRVATLLPSSLFCWYFENFMLPMAMSDLNAVRWHYLKKMQEDKFLLEDGGSQIKLANPVVICMSGLPQTGKTTIARRLMLKMNLFHIDSNTVRAWLIDEGLDYRHVNTMILFFMTSMLKSKVSVVMDSDNILPIKRAFVEALAKKYGAKTEHIYTSVDATVWRNRLSSLDYKIHRLYADGVAHGNESYTDIKDVPRNRILQCVIGEYLRQAPGHAKYRQTLHTFAEIKNNGNDGEIKDFSSQISERLFAKHGVVHV